MNKRNTFLLLISMTATTTTRAQSHSRAQVLVTWGDSRLDYCENDQDLALASVHFNVKISNYLKEPLIVPKKFAPSMNLHVVSMSGSTVYSPHPSYYETERDDLGAIPDDHLFEIVKPGGTAERELVIGIPVSKTPAHPVSSMPVEGSYRVSAVASIWPFYADEVRALKMRRQWRKYGFLYLGPVEVKGAKIVISLPLHAPMCTAGTPDAIR